MGATPVVALLALVLWSQCTAGNQCPMCQVPWDGLHARDCTEVREPLPPPALTARCAARLTNDILPLPPAVASSDCCSSRLTRGSSHGAGVAMRVSQLMPCEVLGRYSLVADWSCSKKWQTPQGEQYRNWTRVKAEMKGVNGSTAGADWGYINGRRMIHLNRGDVVRDKAPFKYFDLVSCPRQTYSLCDSVPCEPGWHQLSAPCGGVGAGTTSGKSDGVLAVAAWHDRGLRPQRPQPRCTLLAAVLTVPNHPTRVHSTPALLFTDRVFAQSRWCVYFTGKHDMAYVSRTKRDSKHQDVIDNSNVFMSESMRVFDLDLVLYPNRRMRLYAACWLGGVRSFSLPHPRLNKPPQPAQDPSPLRWAAV